uniref:Uncharacterized protein n=1 Tax=Oryza rufipogon TaxID=4529 RepID=A0A0E0QEM0_ORYRU
MENENEHEHEQRRPQPSESTRCRRLTAAGGGRARERRNGDGGRVVAILLKILNCIYFHLPHQRIKNGPKKTYGEGRY